MWIIVWGTIGKIMWINMCQFVIIAKFYTFRFYRHDGLDQFII